jgi:hypothetical protein
MRRIENRRLIGQDQDVRAGWQRPYSFIPLERVPQRRVKIVGVECFVVACQRRKVQEIACAGGRRCDITGINIEYVGGGGVLLHGVQVFIKAHRWRWRVRVGGDKLDLDTGMGLFKLIHYVAVQEVFHKGGHAERDRHGGVVGTQAGQGRDAQR